MARQDVRWVHRECGGLVVFDLSGGFCINCHAENLDAEDCEAAITSVELAALREPRVTDAIDEALAGDPQARVPRRHHG